MSSANVNENKTDNVDGNNKEYEEEKDNSPENWAGENVKIKETEEDRKEEGDTKVEDEETIRHGEETVRESEGTVRGGEETAEGEHKIVEGEEKVEGVENIEEGEEKDVGTEQVEGEEGKEFHPTEGERVEGEQVEGEQTVEVGDGEHEELGKYDKLEEEQLEGEIPEEPEEKERKEEENIEEEIVEEEPEYVEEPVDPTAPLNLTDSEEALRPHFQIRPDQLAQVEKLWALYQDYTPAYSDIDGYITIKELVYMLKCLFLMTYTEEQLMELVDFCVRPKDVRGHITYEQFLHMVTIRWRNLEICDELRSALQNYDPEKTGEVQAEELREVLGKLGNRLSAKVIEEFIKEIDISGEGKIGVEDVVAIVGMDMMQDEIGGQKADDEEF